MEREAVAWKAPWRIDLLGELRAVHASRVVTHFRSQKTGLLLAYLAYYLHRPHRREQLCEWLWPEGDPNAARHNLRNVLHWLRQGLEPAGAQAGTILLADRTTVQLNSAAVTTDVAAFSAALEAAARAEDSTERARCLAEAVDLYRGELLPGYYDDWVLQEREWLAERFFQALGQRIAHLEHAGDLDGALEMAHRGLSLDPLREEVHAELIRLHASAGQPAAALRQYGELERLLQQELAATPSAATRALARQIERQTLVRRSAPRDAGSRPPTPRLAGSEHGAPSAPPTRDENRLVTVLFADMSRSVETMRDLHPEDAAALVNRLLGVMVDAVLKYEGHVDRFLGDGVLAVFGLFQAHEDDAERAILAGLEIREVARKLGLEVTGGINTGVVYVGAIGSERHQERTVIGAVVNLASRLQEQAQPGQILVGAATHHQSRGAFAFTSRSLSVQGLPQPVRTYAVAAPLPQPRKARGVEGRRAALIGRERELAQLREALAAVERGQGQIVSLIGEAGVGKSRLVAELRSGFGVRGSAFGPDDRSERRTPNAERLPLWLEGRCLELNITTGYSLFLDLLRDYFAWRHDETEQERAARLAATLQEMVEQGDLTAERAEEMAPLLGNLLSLRSRTDWDLRLKNAAPEQIRHQTLLALQEFFIALARRQPLALILEDLHWADPLSLDGISLLMEALPQAPLLLLCVYRPEREHRCWQLATLASRKCSEGYTEITLRELTPPQSRRLITSLLGSEQVPPSVTEAILRQAQGNPFFVEEVIHARIDTGTLYQEGKSWQVREEMNRSTVPGSVQSVILSRVDPLNPETRHVLASAAVMGRLFRRRLLEYIAGIETPMDTALWELEERGLIYQERVAPEEEYSFKHVLTQETIYDSLLRQQRAALHQQVGEAVEALHGGESESEYEQLAYHYERSEASEKAVEYLLKAGEKARRAYLNEAAVDYFQRALERLDACGESGVRAERRLAALRGLGQVYQGTGREAEAAECFRQAIALGRGMTLAPHEHVRLYYWLGDVLWWQGRYGEMARLGEEGLALLGEETESAEAAMMNDTIAMGYGSRGDMDRWREFIYRNARFVDRLPYSEELRTPYSHILFAYAEDRKMEEAWKWLRALEQQAERHHDLRALAEMHRYAAGFVREQGDLCGARSRLERALELMRQIGDTKHQGQYLLLLGIDCCSLGDLAAAVAYTERALEAVEAVGARGMIRDTYLLKGALALCEHSWEDARQAFQRAADHGDRAEATLALGRMVLAQGDRQQAEQRFGEVTAFATGAEDPFLLLRALSGLETARDNPEEFRAYCDRVREEHAEAGFPFRQWYLEPVQSLDGARCQVLEELTAPLSSAWVWHDPLGDGCFTLQNGLEIHAANGRDLSGLNVSAPRLLRPASGEFGVATICLPASAAHPAIGGLLLWKDRETYLRLEWGTWGPDELLFRRCLADSELIVGRGRLPSDPIYLRLERIGNQVKALCSANGKAWFSVGSAEFPVQDPVEAGVYAIGAIDRTIYPGAYPEGTAIRFTSFTIRTEGGS